MKTLALLCVLCVLSALPRSAEAQRPVDPQADLTPRAIVTENAAIYLRPEATRTPLRTAAAGTQLRVLDETSGWLKVEFQDPQYGRREGYIESRFVQVSRPDLQPLDLSVPQSAGRAVPAPERDQLGSPDPSRKLPVEGGAPAGVQRTGFWFSGGLGYGSLGCDDCLSRLDGLSGGIALGGTITPNVLFGVGTSGWARTDTDVTIGLLDARFRFYPSRTNGFFVTAGAGVGSVSTDFDSELGFGLILGVGYDIRVGRNVSLTPFWNGFAMQSSTTDANVGQLGLSITIH
jgi:hypothetical protein